LKRQFVLPILILFLVQAGFGFNFGIPSSPFEAAEGLPARVIHQARASAGPASGHVQASGYRLVVLTEAIGVDVSTGFMHIRRGAHRGGLLKATNTGHSWIIVESPGRRIECGLTPKSQKWFDGVRELDKQGDPNPIAYLWCTMDGKRHGHLLGIHPTFAARVDLTAEQHAALVRFIDRYDFRSFNLVDHECANFVVETARQAGLTFDYQLEIDLPPIAPLFGRLYRFWTDPRYAKLVIACPDILEQSLREYVAHGMAQDVTKLY
jgi:hypothetical protein